MALQVGELVSLLSVDDRAYNRGLAQAEQALRQADSRMESEAERAGRAGGEALGSGYVRGADGQWRTMRAELVDATTAAALEAETAAMRGGRQIGQALGQGMEHEARAAGEDAGEEAGQGLTDAGEDGADTAAGGMLDRLKGGLKAGVVGVGAMAGALLMSAFSDAMEQGKVAGRLQAQLGATPEEAKRYGHIAGSMYADAVTEDFQGAADAISATMRAGILPTGATEKQVETISTGVSDLASTFELDLGQTANAVGQMLKTGLAKDGKEALDVLTRGMQEMGPRADDLMDTFNEYSTQFRQLGLDATTATGLLSQGMQAGARDTDVVADALKEFVLQTQGGAANVKTAFQQIGLDGDKMQKVFSEGGPEARDALDEVFDRLRKVEDPAKRAALATALFGTKAEDTQKALFALDPSSATKALGDVGGAAGKMGDSLRDNAGTKVEQFKRGIQQGVVDFLGTTVIPALEDFRTYMGGKFGKVWDDAGKGAEGMGGRIANFMSIAGGKIAEVILTEWIPNAVNALPMLGVKMAEYFTKDPIAALKILAIAGAMVLALMYLPEILIGSLAAVAGLILGGLVQKLVEATTEKLPLWWASFKGWVMEKAGQAATVMDAIGSAISDWFSGLWNRYIAGPTSRAWASWVRYVQGIPGRTVSALGALGTRITEVARNAWQRFRDGAVNKVAGFITWVKGIPGRVKSSLGNAGMMLYNQGRDIVVGLWNGIKSTGSWLWSTLTHWALAQIPAPIAEALEIGSPSKLMANKIGKWIPAGVAAGIHANSGVVDDAMSSLVSTPAIGSPMVGAAGGAGAHAGAGGGGTGPAVLRIEFAGQREMLNLLRGAVADGGGDVQVVLGRRR
jgi:phage-related minor tail protein